MKKLLSKVLVCALFVTTLTGAQVIFAATEVDPSEKFSDVIDNDWYEDTLALVIEEGIIDGYPDGTFRGEEEMTIDQFIKTMVVAIDGEQPLGQSYWASEYIARAMELDLIEEDSFSNYEQVINRAEMAMIAYNTIYELGSGYICVYGNHIEEEIQDYTGVSASGYGEEILNMYEQGILLGYPDGEYKPNDGLKRQEAITVIARVIDESYRKPYVYGDLSHVSYWSDELIAACEETGIIPFEVVDTSADEVAGYLSSDNLEELREAIGDNVIVMNNVGTFIGHPHYTGDFEPAFDIIMPFTNDENKQMIVEQCFREIMRNYMALDDEEIEKVIAEYQRCNIIAIKATEEGVMLPDFGEKAYFYDIYGRQLFTILISPYSGFKVRGSFDV